MADAKHPLAGYLAHGLTTTQRRYLDWLITQTGFVPDEQSFKIAVALRDQFAKSPANKAYLARRKAERQAADAAIERLRKEREKAERDEIVRHDAAVREVDRKAEKAAHGIGDDGLRDDGSEPLFSEEEEVTGEVLFERPPAAALNPQFSDGGKRTAAAGQPY